MGKVEIEMTSEDITFSWVEGNFHSVAAMRSQIFADSDGYRVSLEGVK